MRALLGPTPLVLYINYSYTVTLYAWCANACVINFCMHIRLKEHLGSGQFGTVYCGLWTKIGEHGPKPESETIEVAVKSMEQGASAEERVKFLQEATIMGQFKHRYILQILGIITGDPVSDSSICTHIHRNITTVLHVILHHTRR